jgi:hypothetical protein
VSHDEAEALSRWYASIANKVAEYPAQDLKRAEPPLRSMPGPLA